MDRIKISQGKKLLILVLCGLLVISSLFYIFVYQVQQSRIADAKTKLAEQNDWLCRREQFMRQHNDLAAYETNLDHQLHFLHGLLPPEMGTADFIRDTERMSLRCNAVVSGIQPGQPVPCGDYCMQSIGFVVHGDYFQLLDFMHALEQGSRFVSITDAAIHGNDDGWLECHLTVYIYALSV